MTAIKRILVPTDFSENASSIYPFVRKTAEKYGSTVDFIHVILRPAYQRFTQSSKSKEEESALKQELEKDLKNKMQREITEGNQGEIFVYEADQVSQALIKHIEKEMYDLVMIASRGSGKSMFTRGSVTEKLIRLSHTPVLSANKGYNPEINSILVPTDLSQMSLEALPMAVKIAAKNNAEIQLLNVHVFESVTVRALGGDQIKLSDPERKKPMLKALETYLNSNANKLSLVEEPSLDADFLKIKDEEDSDVVNLSLKIDQGFSAQEIITEYALSNNQLVVMATHGRGAMAQLFIGSTTEKVARHLRLPVITIKPEKVRK